MRIPILLLFISLLSSCGSQQSETRQEPDTTVNEILPPDTLVIDSAAMFTQTLADPLLRRLQPVSDSLQSWNFEPQDEKVHYTKEDVEYHWLLKFVVQPRGRYRELGITDDDYARIDSIRHFEFKRGWSYVIEEWSFKNEGDAQHWLEIHDKMGIIDSAKPPRRAWIENEKIYIVMATAARDWFEHSKEVLELFGAPANR